ncbi:MAG: tRNA (cytidine32/uridine32-2'-O)-methyltransferase [Oleiphilaceae bacterium]
MNQDNFADRIKIVLMRTTHPGNVGAVARAMKNMGLKDLSLVSPEFNKVLSEDEALRRSAGAEDILSGAKKFTSLDDAVSDCHVLIGASARSRKMPWPLMNPRDCAIEVMKLIVDVKETDTKTKVAFLFGQEASGLSNEELHRCHYHVNIPAIAEFSSLNLAMAVQVICYELRMGFLYSDTKKNNKAISAIVSPKDEGWDEPLASVNDVEGFLTHLEETLIKTEFHNPNNPRQLMTRLRRLFQRSHLDQMEVNILRGILTSVQKGFK